jgi:hypothetical protein
MLNLFIQIHTVYELKVFFIIYFKNAVYYRIKQNYTINFSFLE